MARLGGSPTRISRPPRPLTYKREVDKGLRPDVGAAQTDETAIRHIRAKARRAARRQTGRDQRRSSCGGLRYRDRRLPQPKPSLPVPLAREAGAPAQAVYDLANLRDGDVLAAPRRAARGSHPGTHGWALRAPCRGPGRAVRRGRCARLDFFSRVPGPRLLPFNEDAERARRSLSQLEPLSAHVVAAVMARLLSGVQPRRLHARGPLSGPARSVYAVLALSPPSQR